MSNLTVFEQFESDIVAFEGHNAELTFDIETTDGEQECRQHLKKLRKLWNGIETMRKATKAEYIAKGKEVDVEAKSFQSRIDSMHQLHSDPLTDKEARIKKEIDDLAEKNRLAAEAEEAKKVADLEAREAKLQAAEDALKAKEDAAKIEADKLKAVEEAKAQAVQDAKDAAEKAEQATKDAVLAAEKKAHEEKNDLIAAQLAEKNAETKRVADLYAKEQAEKDAADEVERKRKADVDHQNKVDCAARNALLNVVGYIKDEDAATSILNAIKNNEIPNVTINY